MDRLWTRCLVALGSCATLAAAANLPYNPTSILLSSSDKSGDYAYIIQPGSDSTATAQFSSLDLSKTLDSSSLSLNSLSSSLPFLNTFGTAYTAFSDPSGNITVLAGDCTVGASGAQLWRFAPDAKQQNGQGTWSQDDTSTSSLTEGSDLAGSNYLSAGIAFSESAGSNASDTGIFIFGGMCPTTGASASKWTSQADYSNLMVTLTPESTGGDDADYSMSLVTSQGPPIAEAGFSMTALTPTYSNTSGVQSQQQDFVLLGGHTQQAFINMSQVAVFALPQESWSFLPVAQPSSLTKRSSADTDSAVVTPRSGHTAVLTSDGKSIIVYGGWVGDVNTPATPQLAVLSLGAGYGGQGSWSWSTPTGSGTAVLKSTGIYGHGAAMLPGNVMMVMGGYTISGSGSSTSRLLKRTTPVQNTQALFYNVSSSTWISSYDVPSDLLSSGSSSSADTKGHLTTTAQKAGLGVGLVIAILAVAAVVGVGVWYMRRRRRSGSVSDGQSLAHEKTSYDAGWRHSGASGQDGDIPMTYSPTKEAFPWLPQVGQPSRREVDTTGAFLNIPSPTRGLRRASGARQSYQYQAAPTAERTQQAVPGIHPIEETDEEGSVNGASRPGTAEAERRLKAMQEIFDPELRLKAAARVLNAPNTNVEDPFRDPEPNPLGSHPVSPEPEKGIRRAPTDASNNTITPSVFGHKSISIGKDQIAGWVNEWSAKNPYSDLHSAAGRVSPTKSVDDRTSSTLSDESQRSYLSARSARSVARTTSTRSNAFFGLAGAPRISPQTSPTEDRQFLPPLPEGRRSPPRGINRNRSITAPSRRPAAYTDSPYGAAAPRATFSQLQAESEALLGASSDPYRFAGSHKSRPNPKRASSNYSQDNDAAPTSPQRRMGTLIGSLRRALGTASLPPAPPPHASGPSAVETYHSAASSPTKHRATILGDALDGPRRTASDSSAFLRLKRGQEDWTPDHPDAANAWEPYRDDVDGGDWGSPGPDASPALASGPFAGTKKVRRKPVKAGAEKNGEEETDWDVEKAAEMRDVQVMFTVPKARLRVVNADVDRASLRSASGGAASAKSIEKDSGPRQGVLVDVDDKFKGA